MARIKLAVCSVAVLALCAVATEQHAKGSSQTVLGGVDVQISGTRFGLPPKVLVIPWHVNYQGYLADDSGNPVNDTLRMIFRIYTSSSAGTELWSESQSVVVEDGLFNTVLGSTAPISSNVFETGAPRWLQLEVERQILSPRTEITSVGYAYRAVRTDSADFAVGADMVDGFNASATPGASDLFPVFYGDAQYVNEGQVDAVGTDMILDGTISRADAEATFRAPYSDTADYAFAAATGADGDWVISGNVLLPSGNYGLAMRGSSVLHGGNDSTHVNFGTSCTTGASNWDKTHCVVSGGLTNAARGDYATVSGGERNVASEIYATVGGGSINTASGMDALVSGGLHNTASGNGAIVGGGGYNIASATYANVAGGFANAASAAQTMVAGGGRNAADANFGTVGGGYSDTVYCVYGSILGGYSNVAGGAPGDTGVVVVGGWDNSATSKFCFVGGGKDNRAVELHATIGGGLNNLASAYATVGGGTSNNAGSNYSTVAGGFADSSMAPYSFTVGDRSYVSGSYDNSTAFNGQAATASGQTRVGTISKAAGAFSIDHPIEPMRKILNHYFVESPEMVLVYRGIARVGPDGRAVVQLPDYFEALNRKPIIQLTGVGTHEVFIAENVRGNGFVIGGRPGTEVHWIVTADRKDQSAEITRTIMPVEQLKDGDLAGRSLDDDFLATTKAQLDRMGEGAQFDFRTARGRQKFEQSRQALVDGDKY